jgi:hypothetical protein
MHSPVSWERPVPNLVVTQHVIRDPLVRERWSTQATLDLGTAGLTRLSMG